MADKYVIEEYSTVFMHWFSVTSFPDIVPAVKEYQYLINEYPMKAYRLVEIHAVWE